MRNLPRQVRGQRRVDIILDAAETLFAEVGYDAATTNEIAARANTSIGSLYQFFHNKESILYAVASRYREKIKVIYDELLTPEFLQQPIPEIVTRLIEVTAEFNKKHTGYLHLLVHYQSPSPVASTARELFNATVARLEKILAVKAPWLSQSERILHATATLTAFNSISFLAMEQDSAFKGPSQEQLIQAAKKMIITYLEAELARG